MSEFIPRFHPPAEDLLDFATGLPDMAAALAVRAHLSFCPTCRAAVADLEGLGGLLLEELAPAPLSFDAGALLEQLESGLSEGGRSEGGAPGAGLSFGRPLAPSLMLPDPLRRVLAGAASELAWRPAARGVSRLPLPRRADGVQMELVRLRAGYAVPRHAHRGREVSLVLAGGFCDDKGSYGPGDWVESGEGDEHAPQADDRDGCIALVMLAGPLRYSRWYDRVAARLLGL